jgi:trans-aconitate 2-methyltransferase
VSTPPVGAWEPEQYHRFQAERRLPFDDLLAMVERKTDMRVVDLGCGTGELTRELHVTLDAAETLGIDNSESMLAKTRGLNDAGLVFRHGDLAQFEIDRPCDLLFSNAALQWVDDHPALLARLCKKIAAGGQLAVQIPSNHDHPSHTLAAELAATAPFAAAMGGHVRRSPVLAPEEYATILHRCGMTSIRLMLRVYTHYLPNRESVVEWVKGTMLTDYKKRLSPEMYEEFLAAYRARLLPVLEDTSPYFYAFKRILFTARKPG